MFGFFSGGLLNDLFRSRSIWRIVSLVRSIGSRLNGPIRAFDQNRKECIPVSDLTGAAATHDHKAVVRVAP
ncbi:hypothetical protein D9M69_208160 [compost metagenome]